jgi:hypothetical protein
MSALQGLLCQLLLQGGVLEAPMAAGFTLEMRERLRATGARFHYETREEWDARMDLARLCRPQPRARKRGCPPELLAFLAGRVWRDELVLWHALTPAQARAVAGC